MKITEYMEQIEEVLQDARIPAEVWCSDNKIAVDITWGDWKHSHAYADCLIMRLPYIAKVDTCVTEEDGSDAYSAIHLYTVRADMIA